MDLDTLIIWSVALVLGLVVVAPFVVRRRRQERHGVEAKEKAERLGLDRPATLHPVVDPSLCAGCGLCTRVCPEGDVLALLGGQAVPVGPARCVGHGLCQRACPTDAIRLVFGTAERGVELPHVQANYETNVPGLFIVGELGGMGLIRNAVEQGLQAADGIAKTLRPSGDGASDGVDVAVVGGGPAGLACALRLHDQGLRVALIEKEREAGGAVWAYPRRKLVMTQPFALPGQPTVRGPEIAKEDLVALWRTAVAESNLPVRAGQTVRAVTPQPDGTFAVEMTAGDGETETVEARRVVLAIGRRGVPRRLGVPGEDGQDVFYALTEPEHFAGRRALVVGGGDAAVEAALALAEQPGTTVALSYRKDRLSRVKPANLERFTAAEQSGQVRALWSTEVARIEPGAALLDTGEEVAADDVFVFIGGELPTAFLRACGVELETKFGEPR